MKLIHLADLHIGKRVNEFSMLEDQKFILEEILGIISAEQPDAVLISGDVYDKPVPSAEAVSLFDDFLVRLAAKKNQIFVISGNHDSAERIAFGGRLMELSGVHMSPVYDGRVEPFTMLDEWGEVHFWMLPFIKPMMVRHFFEDREITTYTDAVRAAVEQMNPDTAVRNILLTHQFVTGAVRSDSEEVSVGGTDNVDVSAFDPFDYVALGHLHGPQKVGRETVRYCGSPLKYSFSEKDQVKSVTVVELKAKGETEIRLVPLKPLHDMRDLKGSYLELTMKSYYEKMKRDGESLEDYFRVILTDEQEIPNALGKLRMIYPNIVNLDYENRRTAFNSHLTGAEDVRRRSPLELFGEFYEKQNNRAMTEEQSAFVQELIEKIWREEE